MTVDGELERLVARADLDGLVAHVDATVASRDWDHLIRVRDASRAAVATGRQLWPAATYANHCLALRAPGDCAVRALDDTARSFMIGPVSEILAASHTWEELAPHLPDGIDRVLVAHERALRGDLGGADEPRLLDIPVAPEAWEPSYAVATYDDQRCDAPAPPGPHSAHVDAECAPGEETTDPDVTSAFRQLVEPWTAESNGRAEVVLADGDVSAALGCLGMNRVRLWEVDAASAMNLLAWAGASGGAHGRRRGAATGRFGAWWLLAALGGITDRWPPSGDEAGDLARELSWHVWDAGEPVTGWSVRLAVHDPVDDVSCAMSAVDAA